MKIVIVDGTKGTTLSPEQTESLVEYDAVIALEPDGPRVINAHKWIEVDFFVAQSEPEVSLEKAKRDRSNFEAEHRKPALTDPAAAVERATRVFHPDPS